MAKSKKIVWAFFVIAVAAVLFLGVYDYIAVNSEASYVFSDLGVCGNNPSLTGESGYARVDLTNLKVIAAGVPFGVRFHTKGVIIVNFCEVTDGSSVLRPALDAGLKKGDVIIKINGEQVNSAKDLCDKIEALAGKPAVISYIRAGKEKSAQVKAALNSDGEYKIGVWVRDSAAGIGTITFVEPKTKIFAGLGHGICNTETGELIPFLYGSAEEVTLSGINPGKAGIPGELRGFFTGDRLGRIVKNSYTGVFGELSEIPASLDKELYSIGSKNDVTEGKAYIFTTVDGSGRQKYEIEISKIGGDTVQKNFTIKITDPKLLALTGGIVQGMSGSPIIQNGKLIGAVTHVLISDPAYGYGIFIENMLSELSGAESSIYQVAA